MACSVPRLPLGGCRFKELCDGSRQSYACDFLIDITRNEDGDVPVMEEAIEMLLQRLDDCVWYIEKEGRCRVKYFYIGKTYVRDRERKGITFDHMNRYTWSLDGGINGRWRFHRPRPYGEDGLVVLTVVTEEAIHPEVCRNFHREDYALALESRLIRECRTDERLYNKTRMPGRRDGNSSIGYALYMAFKV